MLSACRDWYALTGQKIGMKPAGGIRTTKDAMKLLVMVHEITGDEWMNPHLFRIGASTLLNDLLMQRQKLSTGHYSGPRYVTND
jgi:deoxyribose-phosphate aldolase